MCWRKKARKVCPSENRTAWALLLYLLSFVPQKGGKRGAREMALWVTDCPTCMRTWVQIYRTDTVKPGTVAHRYCFNAPRVRWQAKTGESPEVTQPGIWSHKEKERPCLRQSGGQGPTSRVVFWPSNVHCAIHRTICSCMHTHMCTHTHTKEKRSGKMW